MSASAFLGDKPEILGLSFNDQFSRFGCGTESGFSVYELDPVTLRFQREPFGGGIGIVEMLKESSFLALVGGGRNPKYSPNKVILWDEQRAEEGEEGVVGELEFHAPVKAVKLRMNRIFVCFESCVEVFALDKADSIASLLKFNTFAHNPKGLFAIDPKNEIMSCPSPRGLGFLDVYFGGLSWNAPKAMAPWKSCESAVACVAFSPDSRYIATASDTGTLIRVWEVANGTKKHEFRRGSDEVVITSVVFNSSCTFLLVASEKPNVHLFSLTEAVENQTMSMGWGSWGSSIWSCAKFSPTSLSTRHCTFGPESGKDVSVIVVSHDGSWFKQYFEISLAKRTLLPTRIEERYFLENRSLSTDVLPS